MAGETQDERPDRYDGPTAQVGEELWRDPAGQSLVRALQMSFRLLTVIMVLVVVAFLLTGITWIKPSEVGIKMRFGWIVETVDRGLTYTWPFPIGEIEAVDISVWEMQVNDFWMHETAADKTKPPEERQALSEGLRPGWDGALFTGDGSLIHVRVKCSYKIRQDRYPGDQTNPVVYYKLNVNDTDQRNRPRTHEMIRSAICRSAIGAAAGLTGESLRTDQTSFTMAVQTLAQQVLDELRSGIRLEAVNVSDVSWPVRSLPDFAAANAAAQEKETQISKAIAEAKTVLAVAAGDNYEVLVGRPWELAVQGGGQPQGAPDLDRARRPDSAKQAEEPRRTVNLISLYAEARRRGAKQRAEQLLEAIDTVLLSEAVKGQAHDIIQRSIRDVSAMLQPLDSRLERYERLLPAYRKSPALMLDRLWAEARDDILSSATVEKFYFHPGDGKVVLKLNRDPSVARQITRALRRKQEEGEGGP